MDEIQVFDIRSRVVDSVVDIFDTMLSLEIALVEEDESTAEKGSRIAGNIGFAGDVVGMLRFEVTQAFSEIMAAEMLGMEVEDLEGDEEVKDVILELCNIIAGNLKSAFNDHGLPCVISTPAITTGNDFDVEILNMARYERFVFRCSALGVHHILIEVCVKSRDDALPDVMKKLTNIDASKFERLDIISTAGDTLIELFELMLSMKLEVCDAADDAESQADRIVASVNFAGEVLGVISIIAERSFARIITGKMIDQPLEKVQNEEAIRDVIGEICNIVGGNLKGGFSDSGLTCEISLPSITSGKDFKIEVLNMARYERFSFQFYEHKIFVEVCVKIDDSVVVEDETGTDETGDVVTETSESPSVDSDPISDDSAKIDSLTDVGGEYAFPEISEIEAKPNMDTPEMSETAVAEIPMNIDFILDIPVEVSVELGKTRMKLHELRELELGKSVVFDNIEDEKLEIFANNQLIAKGEVVVEKGKYGIRITEVVSRIDRIRKLK
jgi:flagellar motor switch protein FliN/FliY